MTLQAESGLSDYSGMGSLNILEVKVLLFLTLYDPASEAQDCYTVALSPPLVPKMLES